MACYFLDRYGDDAEAAYARTRRASAWSSFVSGRFFDARTFAAQFGTQEARDHLLEGLTKAGFH